MLYYIILLDFYFRSIKKGFLNILFLEIRLNEILDLLDFIDFIDLLDFI